MVHVCVFISNKVDKHRPYLSSYTAGRTDYINAVILPVSFTCISPHFCIEQTTIGNGSFFVCMNNK